MCLRIIGIWYRIKEFISQSLDQTYTSYETVHQIIVAWFQYYLHPHDQFQIILNIPAITKIKNGFIQVIFNANYYKHVFTL